MMSYVITDSSNTKVVDFGSVQSKMSLFLKCDNFEKLSFEEFSKKWNTAVESGEMTTLLTNFGSYSITIQTEE